MATLGSTGEQAQATQQGVATICDSGLAAKCPTLFTAPKKSPFIRVPFSSPSDVDPSRWTDLPLTSLMGIPLQYRLLHNNEAFQTVQAHLLDQHVIKQGDSHRGEENMMLATLAMDIDSGSPRFAQPSARAYCDVLFRRLDGQDMDPLLFEVIDCFVRSRSAFYKLCLDGKIAEARKTSGETFNKKQFVMFFREYRGKVMNISKDVDAWRKLACPVELEENICDSCCKEGKKLMACGQCKVAVYCGKECQRQHWGLHKRFCKHMSNAR